MRDSLCFRSRRRDWPSALRGGLLVLSLGGLEGCTGLVGDGFVLESEDDEPRTDARRTGDASGNSRAPTDATARDARWSESDVTTTGSRVGPDATRPADVSLRDTTAVDSSSVGLDLGTVIVDATTPIDATQSSPDVPAVDVAPPGPELGTVCHAGDHQCVTAVLQRCNESQTGWVTEQTCATAALCSATAGRCLPPNCTPGALLCAGAELQRCVDGTSWTRVEVCAAEALCDSRAGGCKPPVCAVGAFLCVAAELQRCTGLGWTRAQLCETEALCDRTTGTCRPPACAVGERRCAGADLSACNAGRTAMSKVETCATSALCDSTQGCLSPVCAIGQKTCNGADVVTCNEGRNGWSRVQSCSSAPRCNGDAGRCDEPVCAAGAYQCAGATLRQCRTDQLDWTDVTTCAAASLCDATLGKCREPACVAGAMKCDGADLQRCGGDAGLAYETVKTCARPDLCSSVLGTCLVCTPLATYCEGLELRQCSVDGLSSVLLDTCKKTCSVDEPLPIPRCK